MYAISICTTKTHKTYRKFSNLPFEFCDLPNNQLKRPDIESVVFFSKKQTPNLMCLPPKYSENHSNPKGSLRI